MGNNPDRGCGNLKPGGCYLQSEMGKGGELAPLVWVLGHHLSTVASDRMWLTVKPRGVETFDPEGTFSTGEFISDASLRPDRFDTESQIKALGPLGIIDHVGSEHYTPWSFACELQKHGPSRRVPAHIAKMVANRCPVKIFFTMSDIPYFEDANHFRSFRSEYCELEATGGELWTPTWREPRWKWRGRHIDGIYYPPYIGENHALIKVLEWASENDYPRDVLQQESFFCGSWITKAVYVLKDDEDVLPEELQGSGLEAIRADAPGE